MFSLCYARRPSYLLCTMFLSLSILHHYFEFNTYTIITLEKLIGVGSIDGSINHLIHGHATFLVSFLPLSCIISNLF